MVKIIDYKAVEGGVEVEVRGMFGRCKMTMPMSVAQFKRGLARYANGALMQVAFKELNATQREFLISGIPADKQDEIFGGSQDEVQS